MVIWQDDNEKAEEEEEEPIPERRIDVEIPKISFDVGRDIHFMKMPNFLSVETRPFERDTYEDEIDDEETLDEEGRARWLRVISYFWKVLVIILWWGHV